MEPVDVLQTIVVPVAVSVGGVAFCLAALYFRRRGRELRTKGVTVRATVVRKFRKAGEMLENCYAVFSFVDREHRHHQAEVRVLFRAWHGLREGETAAITYLPDQPEKAGLGPVWGRKVMGAFLLYLALCGATVAVLAVAFPVWDFLQSTDASDSTMEIVVMGLFVAGFPTLFILSRRQSARQREAVAEFAAARGWRFVGGDAAELLPWVQAFGPDEAWSVRDIARTEGPSDRLYLFGYHSRRRAGRSSGSNGFACLADCSGRGPDELVTIYPRIPVLEKLMAGKVEVGEPDFRRAYVVLCRRRDVAEAVVTAGIQKLLLDHAKDPQWVVEVGIAAPGVLVMSSHANEPREWDHLASLSQGIRTALGDPWVAD